MLIDFEAQPVFGELSDAVTLDDRNSKSIIYDIFLVLQNKKCAIW